MIQENHSLTEKQIQHFETFGFLVRRQVFSPEEIERIDGEFEKHLVEMKEEYEQKKERPWPNWSNLIPETPYIANLLEDPRICVPTEQLLGEDTAPVYSNANSMNNSTGWHPDMIHRHIRGLKNLIYLQPTDGDHGSLRLIPGSHMNPMFDELIRVGLKITDDNGPQFLKDSGMRGEDIPAYIFCSQPGDVITFNQNTWHAAFNCFEDRRLCTFGFYSNPKTSQEEEELHALVERSREHKKTLTMSSQSQYHHPWWLSNPEGSTRRARWIEWLENWGFIEAMNN